MGNLASHLSRSLPGWRSAWVAIIAVAAVLGVSQVPAAAAPLSSASAHHATARAGYPCSPLARGDYVHISSTLPTAASGHGWWLDNGCNEPRGTVCITLQEFKSGSWHNEAGPNCASLTPGSSHKVGARRNCSSTTYKYWRSHVTVSTSGGLGFGSDSTYTTEQPIGCTV